MAETRALRSYDGSTDGWGMLCPVGGPACSGDGDQGIDWTCPQCDAVLVRRAINERQFLDLLFCCYGCGGVVASPVRKAGHPLAGRSLLFPPGEYKLGRTVEIGSKPMLTMVGQQAVDGYVREIGSKATDAIDRELTPTGLRAMAAHGARLLGDRYGDLIAADERGRSSQTPPARRHRLIELITYAREAADEVERANGEVVTLD